MIYLDHHATTPLDPRVLEAMLPYFKNLYGNPASRTHKFGWDAEDAVETAREQLAALVNCSPHNIIFTSGATESNNIVLQQPFKSIITSTIEHSSVIETCTQMGKNGRELNFLKPNKYGIVDANQLKDLPEPDLVSLMFVNNEIGTIQNISGIDSLRGSNTLFHSDMAQALGKISVDVEKLNVDFASFSAHKIYGPKGVGALYVKKFAKLVPTMFGGKQEYGKRPGTLNVPAIVGFGKACEIIKNELEDTRVKLSINADLFLEQIFSKLDGVKYHNFYPKVPGSIHISLPCNDMTHLLGMLSSDVAVSITGACMSINNEPSRVLKEVGMSEEEAKRSIRVCVGKFNTSKEISDGVDFIVKAVKKIGG